MRKFSAGFSLLEVLIVVTMFALLGFVISQATIDTLRTTRKSSAIIDVRENLELAVASVERRVRNSEDIDPCMANMTAFDYVDEFDQRFTFQCLGGAINFGDFGGTLESISSPDVNISSCDFSCIPETLRTPKTLSITVTGIGLNTTEEEGAEVTVETQVNLRNY